MGGKWKRTALVGQKRCLFVVQEAFQGAQAGIGAIILVMAGCLIQVLATNRAKSFTIWLAERVYWDRQEHFFPYDRCQVDLAIFGQD